MRRISLLLLFATTVFAQTGDSPASETNVIEGRASLSSGAVFVFRSVLRPAGSAPSGLGTGGIWSSGNTVHRYMIDRSSGSYFGYDVAIGTADSTGAYLVTFQPLTQIEKVDDAANLKLVVLPKYPAPQLMHDGEIIELDLMVSPDGRRKLTDVIAIRQHETPLSAPKMMAAPLRDFTVDDGPITFDVSRYELLRQGQFVPSGFTGKPGKTLWVAIPGQGRYILSLTPHDGFAKSGAVRDNLVAFEAAGQRYQLIFQSPVAGSGKAWNLYVLYDPAYSSPQSLAGMTQFGTDRLENLLPR